MQRDRIELRGLRLVGICGALPEERSRPQPLEVDLDLEVDLSAAGGSDELTDTVDYGAVCALVSRVVEASTSKLLEHLAVQVLEAMLSDNERIEAVTISLRKLRPPVPLDLASAGVRVTRTR